MQRLQQLNLGWCACIGDSEVAVLQGHAALAQLVLSGTQVSCPDDLSSSRRAQVEYLESCLTPPHRPVPGAACLSRSSPAQLPKPHPHSSAAHGARPDSLGQVGTAGLQCLVGLKQLTSLSLACCQHLDDAALAVLATLSSLQVLCLERCKGTGLTSSGTLLGELGRCAAHVNGLGAEHLEAAAICACPHLPCVTGSVCVPGEGNAQRTAV